MEPCVPFTLPVGDLGAGRDACRRERSPWSVLFVGCGRRKGGAVSGLFLTHAAYGLSWLHPLRVSNPLTLLYNPNSEATVMRMIRAENATRDVFLKAQCVGWMHRRNNSVDLVSLVFIENLK